MNEIIRVNYDSERPTVLGRELHDMLGVETRYNDWFRRMCEYGFTENVDFYSILSKTSGRPSTDHQLTIPMAKEICMLQRTERGKECRQYFIKIEEQWNSPDAIMQRALQIANGRVEKLRDENRMLLEKNVELLADAECGRDLQASNGITTTSIAKEFCMSARALNGLLHGLGIQHKQSGQWLLYSRYHGKGLTTTRTIPITRSDGRKDVKRETVWTMKGHRFICDKLAEQGILPNEQSAES